MSIRLIYLDYAATTPVDPEVLKAMEPYFADKFGNPSSIHHFGQEALKAVDESREVIKNFLGAKVQREIIFTGSATEANNLAIKGVAFAKNLELRTKNLGNKTKPHIITSEIEHESVLGLIQWLEKHGFAKASYLKPTKEGLVRVEDIEASLKPETVLVSIHYANNEIGTIQPIREIAKVIKKFRNNKLENQETKKLANYPYFHTDAVQAIQFLDPFVNKLLVDLMTISAHKIYGPKGIGALYVREDVNLDAIVHGGGQEYGARSGTENVPLIVGFAKAIEIVQHLKETESKRLKALRDSLLEKIRKIFPQITVNGSMNERLPHNLNITFPGMDGETLLIALSEEGVGVSSGSACSARAQEPSHVLLALGHNPKNAKASLRITLGRQTEQRDLDDFLEILSSILTKLRK